MRKFLTLFLLLIAGFFLSTARADDGVTVTGEKGLFTVLTSDTLPAHNFSFSVNHNNIDRDPLDVDIAYYSVTFGYGVTDNLEFVAMVTPFVGYDIDPKFPFTRVDTVNGRQVIPLIDTKHGAEWRDGFGDIQVGAKYSFIRSDRGGIGVRGFIKIPTADEQEGVGTGKADVGFDFIASGVLGDVLGVAGNVGYTWRGDPDFRDINGNTVGNTSVDIGNPFRYGVGINLPATSRVQAIAELTGEQLPNDAEFDDSTDLTLGVRFRFGSSWWLSLGARRNLQAENNRSQYPNGGIIGLAYAPGRAGAGEAVPPPPAPPTPPPAPPPPAPTPAPAPPPTPEFVWPEVYFPFDQYVLTPETRSKLDSVATYMTDHPDINVTVEGHCCYIGTDEYNLALGQHRADAIKDYLVGKGIADARLRTISYGESRPKYDNSKEITRRFNRRGFFVVLRPE